MTTNVAVLGLGLMGSGMAHRLIDQGFAVTVWNRSADRTVPLGEAGAHVAPTPADAARNADVVIAMLADDDASRATWLGDGGALAALPEDAIAIECSTLTRDWTCTLAGEAAARNIQLLDAPVTGSRVQARSGELRFLVGGDRNTLDRVAPVLDALGTESIYLGPSGSGATLKLINNYLCGVQVASLAEAIAAIEHSGLDPATALRLITSGAPGSPIVGAVSARMLDRAYDPQFLVTLMAKDLAYAGKALGDLGIVSSLASAARDRFLDAERNGQGQRDIAAAVEPLRSPPSRLGEAIS